MKWQFLKPVFLKVVKCKKLQEILLPDTGIYTNIGWAHQSGFKNMQDKIQEKLLLFKNSKTITLLPGITIFCTMKSRINYKKVFLMRNCLS